MSDATADAARFLMAAGDADADGVTSDELAEMIRGQLTPAEILRLRAGCSALIRAIDKLIRNAPR